MKQEYINEIKALIILTLGMILLASLISFVPEDLSWYTTHPNIPAQNLIRTAGAYLAGSLFFLFGYSAYFLVFFLFYWSWNQFLSRRVQFSFYKFLGLFILFCATSAFFSMIGQQENTARFERSGITGLLFSDFLLFNLDRRMAFLVLFIFGALALVLTGEFLVFPFFLNILQKIEQSLRAAINGWERKKREHRIAVKASLDEKGLKTILKLKEQEAKAAVTKKEEANVLKPQPAAPKSPPVKPKIFIAQNEEKEAELKDDYPKMVGEYHLPSLDLLQDAPSIPTSKLQQNLMHGARLLEETLNNFGVDASVVDIERGPVVTRYELEPAPGVKVQKILILTNDIALAMRAQTVRIVAPIPGKNRVGIEVPNDASASVYLKEVLANGQFRSSASKLMLALGKDISGQPLIADLAEMPHLLIAGTTGSGKTVCVNGIITAMLFNASPDEVKFVMVDPKMVELSQYSELPHLLCPPVTDVRKVANVLNWVVGEMENRYKKLSKENVRNIKGYNEKGLYMPYIVLIIDELADLMQVSAKTVESSITRLAQLSRAVGIHLILATQRPSVDVVTGVIKANFPARISFKVASKVDSRTVLDMNGAESLLGKGDMLFLKPGEAKPIRGQCSFVQDKEIQSVIEFITKQQKPVYDENILMQQKGEGHSSDQEKDEYYDEAVKLVIETNQASVSILQRRLRLGYTRAARLIDMMEQGGIVGPYCGSKPREILIDREQWLLDNMNEKQGQQENAQSQS